MPLDSVPWFVGGGAVHSPEVARVLAYAATNGNEGIVTSSDLRVTATGTPSSQVQISVGAGIVLNRAVGGSLQSYIARMPTSATVGVSATSSSGPRRDLVVLQVEDPYMSGEPWQDPADPTVGPYVFIRVIPNVPAGTTDIHDVSGYSGRSAITLARIDIPASTATITNSMITDLRTMANPRETTVEYTDFGTSTATLNSITGTLFPPYTPSVPVPTWATYARITLTIAQLQATGNSTGVGNASGRDTSNNVVIDGDQVAYNFDAVVTSTRGVYIASTYGNISSLRGKTLRPTSYMRKTDSGQAPIKYDSGSQMLWRITFYEKAA